MQGFDSTAAGPGRWARFGPQRLISAIYQHRDLIGRLSARELSSRYRGAVLGPLWPVLTPILQLLIYGFAFGLVLQVKLQEPLGTPADFPLYLFSGLILFQAMADPLTRAPTLMLMHRAYVKKVVFPLEILPHVQLVAAAVNLGLALLVLLVAQVALTGALPPATVALAPLIALPLFVLVLGLVWLLASLGVFLRDLGHAVALAVTLLLFTGAVFYPIGMVPEAFRGWLALNPLTVPLQAWREVLLYGRLPDFAGLGLYSLVALAVGWLGLVWFEKTRKGFADVL